MFTSLSRHSLVASLFGLLLLGTVSLVVPDKAQAQQDLYVSITGTGTINRINAGGTVSTFVTGLNTPVGLRFNADNNLLLQATLATRFTKSLQRV